MTATNPYHLARPPDDIHLHDGKKKKKKSKVFLQRNPSAPKSQGLFYKVSDEVPENLPKKPQRASALVRRTLLTEWHVALWKWAPSEAEHLICLGFMLPTASPWPAESCSSTPMGHRWLLPQRACSFSVAVPSDTTQKNFVVEDTECPLDPWRSGSGPGLKQWYLL